MTYREVIKIGDSYLLPIISELYELVGYKITLVKAHDGGRNVVYRCEKEGAIAKIIRIAFLDDRNQDDFLAEVEYIRYLYEHGASVSNVISSRNGNLLEEITYDNHIFYICVFERAKGKLLVENSYRYREGFHLPNIFITVVKH